MMAKKRPFRLRFAAGWALICLLYSTLSGWANDPGGGTNGVGANVTVTDNGSTVTLANGTLTATITKSSGTITSLLFRGRQMVSGNIYFSVDGGTSYENPANGVYAIKTNTTDRVDLSFRCTMTNHHWFNVDIHYALGRGDSGLYVYAVLDHPASYPDTGVGEWRMVWKMSQDQTERIYVDDIRNWQKPSSYDLANAQATGIAEIVKLTTGAWTGRYTCKYMYAVEYENVGCYGHASNPNKIGAWAVFGNFDYFNDGPTKQDLAPADGIIHIHFGRNHYNASSTTVAAGEAWTKFYGPWLLYCNTNAAGGDACWADAKAQVEAEKVAQPYAWLVGNTNYPPASGRGAVSGTFIISDPLKPALAVNTNTWIGLAQPDAGGNWQFESKRYQYWVHPAANGSFTIPNVRPGTYTLSAIAVGAVGEFTYSNSVTVTAGATNALGTLTWNVPHPGGQIAWEIGIPDRTAKEFRHGTNYWEPYLWVSYSNDFPNPLTYAVGTSNWTNDWNYAHSGYNVGTNWSNWKWRINFTLTNLPASGNATMTFAFASINYGAVQVFVNNESSVLGEVAPTTPGGGTGGNALIREGIHAKYSLGYFSVPLASLHLGTNTITLVQRRSTTSSDHVMYDYINLELPAGPPPPPPGRNISWRGGNAANAWDVNTTLNFVYTNGLSTTFTNGDNVTFDDTGSNHVPISINAAVTPGLVTVAAAKNFYFSGNYPLLGTMALNKSGAGTLVLGNSNAFGGGTYVSDGTILLTNDTANTYALGSGPVTLVNATLTMYANFGTYNASTWNLVVPPGATATLNADSRCDLYGTLTGGGTLNLRIPDVRTTLFANWSAFTGVINALASGSGGKDFRIGPDYSWAGLPNAALNLGTNINAYWIGNLNSGAGSFVDLGEVSGVASSKLQGGNVAGRSLTYRVGNRNTDATFAGSISDQLATSPTHLLKLGAGTWTLAGTNTYSGTTAVSAGTLQVFGMISNANTVVVSNNATLDLSGTITGNRVQINAGGTLTGCGTINANLLNNGTVLAACGAPGGLTVNGNVTNNGAMQILSGTTLTVSGTFVNNGLLDLLTGAQNLPVNFVNNGTVLLAANVVINSFTQAAGTLALVIQGYDGHTYQLQRSAALNNANWQNVGPAQDGAGAPLLFTDTPGGSQNFYRVLVSP